MAALWAGALVKTVPTKSGAPFRTCRMTVQEPDASMWKPRCLRFSSVCSAVWLKGDAKNCKREEKNKQQR